jgi:solute carrier family 35 (adenosine 3'-phospho 5'-phosphosulfate transporter), member B2
MCFSAGSGWFTSLVRFFVDGLHPTLSSVADKPVSIGDSDVVRSASISEQSSTQQCLQLIFCAAGLLGSYLIWGLLQERIMAFDYSESGTKSERFTNSQFLVFMNRILALAVAVVAITLRGSVSQRQPPLYKYSYGSFSNIMSSWCQYEALKFVSFPVQVHLVLFWYI